MRRFLRDRMGQTIVEFALVLPLFLLIVFGTAYFGMAFADYSTLNNLSRDIAREAAYSSDGDYTEITDRYTEDVRLISGVYVFRGAKDVAVEYKDNSVNVEVRAQYNSNSVIAKAFKAMMGTRTDRGQLVFAQKVYSRGA